MGLALINIIPGPLLPLAHTYQNSSLPDIEGWQNTEEAITSPKPYVLCPFCSKFDPGILLGIRVP